MTENYVSDVVAAKVKDLRRRSGWSTTKLASRCAKIGHPEITRSVIENIEGGRRRDGERTRAVTVDELVALADALECVPAYLLPGQIEPGNLLGPMDLDMAQQVADGLLAFVSLHRQLEAERGNSPDGEYWASTTAGTSPGRAR